MRINEQTSPGKKINRTYCSYLKGACNGEKPDVKDPTYFTLSPVKMTGLA